MPPFFVPLGKVSDYLTRPFVRPSNPSSRDFANNRAHTNTKTQTILILSWRCLKHPQAGGSEISVFERAEQWAAHGHHVTVFTADPGRTAAPERNEIFKGVDVIRRGGRFTVYLYAALFLLLLAHRFDVILDVSNGIPFFAPLFSRKPTTLLVHHVHNEQWFRELPRAAARVGWFLESRVVPFLYRDKQVIVVSPTTENEMLKLGYRVEQMHLIFNGLRIGVPLPRHEPDSPRVTYVGRLKAYKRLHLLIAAVDKLRDEFPNIHLDIVGTGDSYDQLIDEVRARELERYVTLHGYVSEQKKANILASTTVFAIPSMQEGWGLSVLEANAYGCPAVAYDVPGLQASIPHNETGLLAKTDEEFVEAIACIIRDDGLRHRLSEGALYWSSLFNWESTAHSTLAVMNN